MFSLSHSQLWIKLLSHLHQFAKHKILNAIPLISLLRIINVLQFQEMKIIIIFCHFHFLLFYSLFQTSSTIHSRFGIMLNSVSEKLKNIDVFRSTQDDFKVKTFSGAISIPFVCFPMYSPSLHPKHQYHGHAVPLWAVCRCSCCMRLFSSTFLSHSW